MIEETATSMRHNLALCFDIGIEVPEFKLLGGMSTDEIHNYMSDPEWNVIDNIAFKKMDGFDVSYIVFWNGDKFRNHSIVVNDDKLLTGGQGLSIDANCVTVFPGKLNFSQQLNKLKKELEEREPGWKGFITFDLTLSEKKTYYRYISFSLKADYLHAMTELANLSIDELIYRLESGQPMDKPAGYGVSLKLFTYPFDFESKYPVEKIPGLRIGSLDLPIVTGYGKTIKAAWTDLYSKIPEDAAKHGVCYRLDGNDLARKTVAFMYNNQKFI